MTRGEPGALVNKQTDRMYAPANGALQQFRLVKQAHDGAVSCFVGLNDVVICGWTGRDREALEKHALELEALGVRRPSRFPEFYRVTTNLLTTAAEIQVIGPDTSGEAEVVIAMLDDGLWIGLGSDHTDRKAETIDITLSKQLCAKPIANTLWRFEDIRDYWDSLVIRSYVHEQGRRCLYQEGALEALMGPDDLINDYSGQYATAGVGTIFFCGTLPAKSGIRPSPEFSMELHDPVSNRTIEHSYKVSELPMVKNWDSSI